MNSDTQRPQYFTTLPAGTAGICLRRGNSEVVSSLDMPVTSGTRWSSGFADEPCSSAVTQATDAGQLRPSINLTHRTYLDAA